MRLINILITLLIFFNFSCKSTEDKLQCLADKQRVWQKDEVYKDVRNELTSTLQDWINNDIEAVRYYKKTLWKIDETVFFNTFQSEAILLVLEQDTALNAKMDGIHMIYAMKEGDKWRFFYKSMPAFSAERYYTDKKNPTTPYTFEDLPDFARKKLVESGYFKKGRCEINDSYINDWYNEELEKKHQEFLNDK